MNQPNETRLTVIEVQYNQVYAIHAGETDTDYLPVIAMHIDRLPNPAKPFTPFVAYYLRVDDIRFWIVANDNGSYDLTRDICRASLFTHGPRPEFIPIIAHGVPAQYFDGYSQEEIDPRQAPAAPPALPAAPPAAMPELTLIDGWTHVKLGGITLAIFMPNSHTADVYLFNDDILSGPQFTVVKQADNDDHSHNAMMWLPTIGITGQNGIFFTSGMHSTGDFIGYDTRAVTKERTVNQVTIKRRA